MKKLVYIFFTFFFILSYRIACTAQFDVVMVKKWGDFGDKPGEFKFPAMIAADKAANVYVVDQHNHRIQKFDSAGNFLLMWGNFGTGPGWQSYNKWPGRDSLYDDGTTEVWYTGPNVRVSFDRPYAKYCQILDAPLSAGSGEFLLWEHPMVYWLEQQGYDVTYCSNLDLHLDPNILALSKVFLSVGHDEYWSRKMYEEAIKARDDGLSFAFFCGNSVKGQINLFDNSINGMTCRAFSRGEVFEDEEKLMGVTSYAMGYGDWVVKNPGHWIYKGTGLKAGDRIPAIVGEEYHGPRFPIMMD